MNEYPQLPVEPQSPAPNNPEQLLVPAPEPAVMSGSKSHKKLWIGLAIILIIATSGIGWWLKDRPQTAKPAAKATSYTQVKSKATAPVSGLQLDPNKNYGNKYASGILPVGDGKYSTSTAKVGYVYACSQYAQNLASDNGGAGSRGPWFTNNNTEYDLNKKLHVQGSVMWQASFTNTLSGSTRTIVTNDLPSHPTGVFPIASSDPAYAYDHNPNSIKGQTLTFALPASPIYNATPNCMGGTAGIMLTGVELNNGFDAGGRDAGAWEVQDSCDGHPQDEGVYHYHTLSSCIKNISIKSVIGFALNGFPITGPQLSNDNMLTTSDLDECHGITSQIVLDGKMVTSYHYVMTQDFPYSISCFRGQAIQPPGMQSSTGSRSQAPTTSQSQSAQPSTTQPAAMPPRPPLANGRPVKQ